MALNANDRRPPYQQIADELLAQMASGELGPGDKLPSARDLMQLYDVANQTVQSALRVLRSQGLINSVPGRGTFVTDDIDADTITDADFDGRRPSSEFVALTERLDSLAEVVQVVQERLDRIEGSRSRRSKPPARKQKRQPDASAQ